MILVSFILSLAVPMVIWVGYLNRKGSGLSDSKGIGWHFIRYTVLGISLPITAILAINNTLTGEAATIIAGAMGYAFGKSGSQNQKKTKSPN